ncbi:MAG: hypothetical protein BroJett011_28130 [Chloroflexota bacterium]|nr:MAG: hypothetical protein BroJett011_28130 [Chloroflexota bacterium]
MISYHHIEQLGREYRRQRLEEAEQVRLIKLVISQGRGQTLAQRFKRGLVTLLIKLSSIILSPTGCEALILTNLL